MEENNNPKKETESEISISWKSLYRIGLAIFLTFTCCILLFFVFLRFQEIRSAFGKLLSASSSIIIGLALAFILNPVNKTYYKWTYSLATKKYDDTKSKKIAKASGIGLTTLSVIAMIVLLGAAVIPSVLRSIMHLVNRIPAYANVIIDFIENGQFGDSTFALMAQNLITQAADTLEDWVENSLLSQAQTYITQITSGVINVVKGILNFIIGIIVMDYVMAIQNTLKGQIKKILYSAFKIEAANSIIEFGRKASDIFGGFITGKIIDSAIIGVISYLGCSILRIPDAVLVSVIIGITNIIPFFGPFIGAVPTLLLVVVQSPIHALYLLIFIIVLQQVDGNIIGPKILGSSTGLSSFWIMVAILIGGGIFGIAGMIFGVPCVAMVAYIIRNVVNKRLRKKNLPAATTPYINLAYIDPEKSILVNSDGNRKKNKK